MPAVPFAALRDSLPGASTPEMAAEVAGTRAVQRERFRGPRLNASIRPGELRKWCGVGRVLRVARTIADLAGKDDISEAHVLEALRWRVEPAT